MPGSRSSSSLIGGMTIARTHRVSAPKDRTVRCGRSAENVSCGGDKHACAAGFGPKRGYRRCRAPLGCNRRDRASCRRYTARRLKMQLFCSSVVMRRIGGSRRQAYQHADSLVFVILREDLALDARRDLAPLRLAIHPFPTATPGCRRYLLRCGPRAAPKAISRAAKHPWATTRRSPRPAAASPSAAGNRHTWRCALASRTLPVQVACPTRTR